MCAVQVRHLLQSYRAETMHGAYKTFVSQTNDISFFENPDSGMKIIKMYAIYVINIVNMYIVHCLQSYCAELCMKLADR